MRFWFWGFVLCAWGWAASAPSFNYRDYNYFGRLPLQTELAPIDGYRQALRRAQSLANEKRYAEALEILQKRIWDLPPEVYVDTAGKYLCPQDQAFDLANGFPTNILDGHYGQDGLYHSVAEKALGDALDLGDNDAILRVSFRFPFTAAGRASALVMIYIYRDKRQDIAGLEMAERIAARAVWNRDLDENGWLNLALAYAKAGFAEEVKSSFKKIADLGASRLDWNGKDVTREKVEIELLAQAGLDTKIARYRRRRNPEVAFASFPSMGDKIDFLNATDVMVSQLPTYVDSTLSVHALGSQVVRAPRTLYHSIFSIGENRILVLDPSSRVSINEWKADDFEEVAGIDLTPPPYSYYFTELEALDANHFLLKRDCDTDAEMPHTPMPSLWDYLELREGKLTKLGELTIQGSRRYAQLDSDHLIGVGSKVLEMYRLNRLTQALDLVATATIPMDNIPTLKLLPDQTIILHGFGEDGINSTVTMAYRWAPGPDKGRFVRWALFQNPKRMWGHLEILSPELFSLSQSEEQLEVHFIQWKNGQFRYLNTWTKSAVDNEEQLRFVGWPYRTQDGVVVIPTHSSLFFLSERKNRVEAFGELEFEFPILSFDLRAEREKGVALLKSENHWTEIATFTVPLPPDL